MTADFILRIKARPSDPVTWRSGGVTWSGTLAEAARAAAGMRPAVIVPGGDVHLDTPEMPTRRHRQLRQALPYVLEERIAADVEGQHFAFTVSGDGGSIHAAVVSREVMQSWVEALSGAGLMPERIVPDVLALPLPEDDWGLLLEDHGFLLRTGPWMGVAAEVDALEPMLLSALETAVDARPKTLHVHDARTGSEPLALAEWCAPHGIALCEEAAGDAMEVFSTGYGRTPAIDLQQGEFSPRERIGRFWRPWRLTAALAGALIALHFGSGFWQQVALDREAGRLEAEIEQIYRSAFPDAQRIVDARAQMQQRLDALQRGTEERQFLRVMTASGPALRGEGVEIQAMRYSPGTLEVDIQAADFQRLDDVRRALETAGRLTAEMGGAESEGGQVRGRLTIREAGA